MNLFELLDAGPSAHTTLSRFAKELIAKGFEAEVKSSSKPGIVNRSKLCIEVKGYGLKDSIKLYRPLFSWEDKSTYFVDTKHERKFRNVKELVDVLKDKYKRLPKCLEYVPPVVKEDTGAMPMKKRILQFQQDLEDLDYAEVSGIIRVTMKTDNTGLTYDRFVFVYDPVEKSDDFYQHYKKGVITIDDWDSFKQDGKLRSPKADHLCSVALYRTGNHSYEELLEFDYSKNNLRSKGMDMLFSIDEAETGLQTGLNNVINHLKAR